MSMKPVTDVPSALAFLHETVNIADCNLNPDLGFLKADNTSAFAGISDEFAQFAQLRLVEAEKFLAQIDVDIYEVCMEFSMAKTFYAYYTLNPDVRTQGLFYPEYAEYLSELHETGIRTRQVIMLGEENDEQRRMRREDFIIGLISQWHSAHPISGMAQAPARITVGNDGTKMAFILIEGLLPEGWKEKLSALISADGAGDITEFKSTIAEAPQAFVDLADALNADVDPDADDNDDDPFGHLWSGEEE